MGVNHHKQTILYACALVSDETEDTYKRVLETFVKVINGQKPSLIVIDNDKAMHKAIKNVLPKASHKLCAWHLEKNVRYVHFTSNFKNYMLEGLEIDWRSMIKKFGVSNHK